MSSVVTIGNFDGVHRGHLALIERATAEAVRRGVPTVALTFDPHPAAVLRPEAVPPALQSLDERVAALRSHGCDRVEVLTFDRDLAALTPRAFAVELLVGRLGAEVVVVGTNFRFGAGASGDVDSLRELGEELGFTVEAVGLVDLGPGPVSSSAIRSLLAAGDVEAAALGLGRPYRIDGVVVRGDGRGRSIGIPTANVAVDPARAVPADGVYACWATVEGEGAFPAAVNIGRRPTFDGLTRTVEAHLIGVDDPDLYGARLLLDLVARIRGEQRFAGPAELVARIHEDVAVARRLLEASRSRSERPLEGR